MAELCMIDFIEKSKFDKNDHCIILKINSVILQQNVNVRILHRDSDLHVSMHSRSEKLQLPFDPINQRAHILQGNHLFST